MALGSISKSPWRGAKSLRTSIHFEMWAGMERMLRMYSSRFCRRPFEMASVTCATGPGMNGRVRGFPLLPASSGKFSRRAIWKS